MGLFVCCGAGAFKCSRRGELERERKRIQWVCVCVCAHTSERLLCGEWVGASVSRPGLSAVLSAVLLSAEWKHHVSVGRPEEQPCFSRLSPD